MPNVFEFSLSIDWHLYDCEEPFEAFCEKMSLRKFLKLIIRGATVMYYKMILSSFLFELEGPLDAKVGVCFVPSFSE